MSFDLAIWRRSSTTKTAMINEVYDTAGIDDNDHPAAGKFDTQELVDAVSTTLGRLPESNDELTFVKVVDRDGMPVGVSLQQWTGETSAIVHVSGPFDALERTIATLLPFVVERNLMLYDAQSRSVYNNRRHYPVTTRNAG